jgi:hypothetical protein
MRDLKNVASEDARSLPQVVALRLQHQKIVASAKFLFARLNCAPSLLPAAARLH